MGRLYTSLPLDNPTRQFYQNVIDNSRKQLVSQMASDRGKVDDGTSFDKIYNNKAEERDKQQALQELYEMMRGGYFGSGSFGLF